MSVTGNVLAIDQGTSGTKAIVVSADRGVIASADAAVRPRYGAGGLVEQDPAELLESVLDAGRRALAAAGEPVDAISLANQGETVLAWDPASGRTLTPAIVWQDRRSAGVCDRLREHADRLGEITGLSLDPYFAAPKMTWLREELTRDGVVTTTDAWLVHQLTGAFVTDASTASRTMLLDLDALAWSAEALEIFGLAGEKLPRIVGCAEPVGETTAFGSTPLPLTGLAVDQQAALFAEGCFGRGDAKCTYGTGAFLLANVGATALRSTSGLAASVAWLLGDATSYCLDGQLYTVGSALRWLADLGVISGPEEIDALGSTVPDAGGVTLVPALAGLAAPSWQPDARASLTGLGLETTSAHVARALVDGIALLVAELADAVARDLGHPLSLLRVDGGLTASRLLMQTQADVLQFPVEVFATPDATALGVAAFARLGLDPTTDVASHSAPAAVYEPQISADEAAARGERFRAVLAATT
jgi:glycerol kinase